MPDYKQKTSPISLSQQEYSCSGRRLYYLGVLLGGLRRGELLAIE